MNIFKKRIFKALFPLLLLLSIAPVSAEEVTTPSGLQIKVIKQGYGDYPKANSTVTVHYHGTLTNGDVFDSSYNRGTPASFNLQQVIKGWTEGIPYMQIGAKYQFTIPPHLAYGTRSMADIPPNSTLIFIVELLKIN